MTRERIYLLATLACLALALWLFEALPLAAAWCVVLILFWGAVAPAILTFWASCVVVHELGHAMAALGLGFRVRRVVIGAGSPIAHLRCAGIPVEIRSLPVAGFVYPEPRGRWFVRLRFALICLAGPAVEFLFLILVLYGIDSLRESTPASREICVVFMWATVPAFASVVQSLIPWTWRMGSETFSSDAKVLLLALFSRRFFDASQDMVAQIARQTKYSPEAFFFVWEGLHTRDWSHLDGRTLCWKLRDRALECFSFKARETLRSWGVERCEDFGEIVYAMVEAGWVGATERDSVRDFDEVYSFDEAFGATVQSDTRAE